MEGNIYKNLATTGSEWEDFTFTTSCKGEWTWATQYQCKRVLLRDYITYDYVQDLTLVSRMQNIMEYGWT